MLVSSRFLVRSCLSQSKHKHEALVVNLVNNSYRTLNPPTSLSIISKRFFAEDFKNNENTSGSDSRIRRFNNRDERSGNRGDFRNSKPNIFNRDFRDDKRGDGGDRKDGRGGEERSPFNAPRPLTQEQQEIMATNKFNQFMETAPAEQESRTKITISIMSNFFRNENIHATILFFNKLISQKDKIRVIQPHYSICMKAQLSNNDEKGALKTYENMKQIGLLPDNDMLGNLIYYCSKSSKLMDILAADAKQYSLILAIRSATSSLLPLLRDREYLKAKNLYNRFLADFNVIPDSRLQSLSLVLLLRDETDKSDEALLIYNKLRTEHSADISVYMTMLRGLIAKKQYEKAEMLLKNMKADGVQPDEKFRGFVDYISAKDSNAAEVIKRSL